MLKIGRRKSESGQVIVILLCGPSLLFYSVCASPSRLSKAAFNDSILESAFERADFNSSINFLPLAFVFLREVIIIGIPIRT